MVYTVSKDLNEKRRYYLRFFCGPSRWSFSCYIRVKESENSGYDSSSFLQSFCIDSSPADTISVSRKSKEFLDQVMLVVIEPLFYFFRVEAPAIRNSHRLKLGD